MYTHLYFHMNATVVKKLVCFYGVHEVYVSSVMQEGNFCEGLAGLRVECLWKEAE